MAEQNTNYTEWNANDSQLEIILSISILIYILRCCTSTSQNLCFYSP